MRKGQYHQFRTIFVIVFGTFHLIILQMFHVKHLQNFLFHNLAQHIHQLVYFFIPFRLCLCVADAMLQVGGKNFFVDFIEHGFGGQTSMQ